MGVHSNIVQGMTCKDGLDVELLLVITPFSTFEKPGSDFWILKIMLLLNRNKKIFLTLGILLLANLCILCVSCFGWINCNWISLISKRCFYILVCFLFSLSGNWKWKECTGWMGVYVHNHANPLQASQAIFLHNVHIIHIIQNFVLIHLKMWL